MAETTEIALSKEDEQRFMMVEGDENDPDQLRTFVFKHRPHYGLLAPQAGSLLVPGLSMAAFNPISLPHMRLMREGDSIIVESDPDDPVYKVWAPPEEFQISKGYRELFTVKNTARDALDFPIAVFERAL